MESILSLGPLYETVNVSIPYYGYECPNGTHSFIDMKSRKCLNINNTQINFQEADEYCRSKGGNLLEIGSLTFLEDIRYHLLTSIGKISLFYSIPLFQ